MLQLTRVARSQPYVPLRTAGWLARAAPRSRIGRRRADLAGRANRSMRAGHAGTGNTQEVRDENVLRQQHPLAKPATRRPEAADRGTRAQALGRARVART